MKPPTQTRETDALIGDEEQNGKQKKKKKERDIGPPTQLSWSI